MIFMETGSQYYTTARFAMHAQCMPVCGNLFHHAVEMLLKGGLAQKGENARLFNEAFCAAAGVLADSSSTKF
jgi:hypothetical protein